MSPRIHSLSRSAWLRSATLRASVLTVVARNGAVLVYGGVPARVLGNLIRSKSPGTYFNAAVIGKYAHLASIPAPHATEAAPEPDLEDLLRRSLAVRGVEA